MNDPGCLSGPVPEAIEAIGSKIVVRQRPARQVLRVLAGSSQETLLGARLIAFLFIAEAEFNPGRCIGRVKRNGPVQRRGGRRLVIGGFEEREPDVVSGLSRCKP